MKRVAPSFADTCVAASRIAATSSVKRACCDASREEITRRRFLGIAGDGMHEASLVLEVRAKCDGVTSFVNVRVPALTALLKESERG